MCDILLRISFGVEAPAVDNHCCLLCLGHKPQSTYGHRRGSIFTVMDSSGKVKIINSRDCAQRTLNPDLLIMSQTFQLVFGRSMVGVLREIRGGYEESWKTTKLPWASLNLTIRLARRVSYSFNWKLYSDKDRNAQKTDDIVKFEAG
ncbi:gamma-glutamyltransferase 5-like protein [Lates japonicus]|uniref:Gamma-glutamyltransferase 5-like protein n=1 Tax=Lates japonicus TaxID=270547 RepID=A0AAD3NMK4_LATJO|nr:gamma-glutamyltransferase 5-like protein [Lates japonicus]